MKFVDDGDDDDDYYYSWTDDTQSSGNYYRNDKVHACESASEQAIISSTLSTAVVAINVCYPYPSM